MRARVSCHCNFSMSHRARSVMPVTFTTGEGSRQRGCANLYSAAADRKRDRNIGAITIAYIQIMRARVQHAGTQLVHKCQCLRSIQGKAEAGHATCKHRESTTNAACALDTQPMNMWQMVV